MKIVIQLPLEELWTEEGIFPSKRERYLTTDDIRMLMKAQPVTFVVADIGKPLRWISAANIYPFYKNEVKEHVPIDPQSIDLESFEGEWAYLASLWNGWKQKSIVLFERYH